MLTRTLFALSLIAMMFCGSLQLFADSPIRICNISYRASLRYCATLPAAQQPACIADADAEYQFCLENPF